MNECLGNNFNTSLFPEDLASVVSNDWRDSYLQKMSENKVNTLLDDIVAMLRNDISILL